MYNMHKGLSRTQTSPIAIQRSTRPHDVRALTSLPAGKMVPLAAIPLLREDNVIGGNFRISFEMMETVEVLMNAINVNVKAYLVPSLAFERFQGMDDFNRSYEGEPAYEGGPVTPFIDLKAGEAAGVNKIHTYLGKHVRPGDMYNTAYVEAYNAIWNFRARNRSPDLTLRNRLDLTLAPAFWQHQGFAHIVPDFDQALIDGEVALNVVNGNLALKGLTGDRYAPVNIDATAGVTASTSTAANRKLRLGTSTNVQYAGAGLGSAEDINALGGLRADLQGVFAELAENGITVSLSNLDLAKKTTAFANIRKQYTGHTEEFLINLLMDGITVPEQVWKQPVLLADRSTVFGMAKRYASDSGNLTDSVVNGATFIDVGITVPRVPVGGVIMIVAEITPEQLFERQKDPYLHAGSVDAFPHYLRDTLDPEKVSVVANDYVDIDHDTPNATFGYMPLNGEWFHAGPCIGGKFIRPTVDAGFDEDRQRIWAVETQNPTLSQDFYLCTTMHQKPFVVTNQDPFEAVTRGMVTIGGNTVFGHALIEASNDYEKVLEVAPQERIEK